MCDAERRKELLNRLFTGGRVSHAYILTGPGREDFAREMAAALVCEGGQQPCGNCPHCKKAAMNIHPDILFLTPQEGKREILVDQVRELRAQVYVRPNEARRKVCLIDPAESLNPSAQNALLKVLEEGPPYAVFLLLSETAGALLPTVRSRCEEMFLFSGQEERTEHSEQAVELADLLLSEEEYPLLRYCVGLEKLSREEMSGLLEKTVSVLEERMKDDIHSAGKIVPMIEKLKTLWEAGQYNTGVGHLAGWLCAAAFS